MNKCSWKLILFMSCVSFSSSANILAIFTVVSPSHHIWNSPLVVELAARGHNVTVLSPEAQRKPVANLTNLVIEGVYQAFLEAYNYEEMFDLSEFQWIKEVYKFFGEGCQYALKSNGMKTLLNYHPNTVFDLIILEPLGTECLLGIVPKFGNPPLVAINAFGRPHWVLELSSTPIFPSFMPDAALSLTDHMTFTQRMKNLLALLYSKYWYQNDYLPAMNKVATNFFGKQLQANKIIQNVSIVMSNFHPVLNYPHAISPTLIPVAGIQIKEPKPMPADLQEFLDNAKEGVIFFSLGSNLRSDKLPEEKKKAIIEALAELPQKVLWKFETHLPGLPKNVKIGKWLPQSDILAHPNTKLFITHCGMLSTHETIHRGVPVVGIPFLADQHINIRKIINHGCGVKLEFTELSKETLINAIHEVIGNPSYRENMKQLSERFRDDPQTPLERAVFWTEYVIRHKGAPHLQSAAKDLNIIQYFLLDVIACLLAIPTVLIFVFYQVCCKRKSQKAIKHKKH